jgi:valyl-tRNA synthetase
MEKPHTSIHGRRWPNASEIFEGDDDGCFDIAVAVMTEIRRAKSEAKMSLRVPVDKLDVTASARDIALLESVFDDVRATGNVRDHAFNVEEQLAEPKIEIQLGEPEPKA